jgi:hypothetical protein
MESQCGKGLQNVRRGSFHVKFLTLLDIFNRFSFVLLLIAVVKSHDCTSLESEFQPKLLPGFSQFGSKEMPVEGRGLSTDHIHEESADSYTAFVQRHHRKIRLC